MHNVRLFFWQLDYIIHFRKIREKSPCVYAFIRLILMRKCFSLFVPNLDRGLRCIYSKKEIQIYIK